MTILSAGLSYAGHKCSFLSRNLYLDSNTHQDNMRLEVRTLLAVMCLANVAYSCFVFFLWKIPDLSASLDRITVPREMGERMHPISPRKVNSVQVPRETSQRAMSMPPRLAEDGAKTSAVGDNDDKASWDDYNYTLMSQYLNCEDGDDGFGRSRDIWNESSWILLREKYRDEVGISTFPIFDPHPPLWYAGHTLDKGRGLFASRDIRKGELMYNGTSYYAHFPDGPSWRKFFMTVPDMDTRCDLMEWSWIQDLGANGTSMIIIALDESSLMNNGEGDDDDMNGYMNGSNIECGREGERCRDQFYASREIAAETEILGNYDEFVGGTSWPSMFKK